MTDLRLRELERRWRESGAPHDEAALLRERVRTGDLPEARLRAAALLGYAPARLAGADAQVAGRERVEALIDALASVGTAALTATVLTLAEAAARVVGEAMPNAAWTALARAKTLAEGGPVEAPLDVTLRSLASAAPPRTKDGKRVRAAVDVVRLTVVVAAHGRRAARTGLRLAIEHAERVLRDPLTAASATLGPRLLHSTWPTESDPVRLLVVEERFAIKAERTIVQPGVDLRLPNAGEVSFMVEVRDREAAQRCLAKATIPFGQPLARRAEHVLVLALAKALVPVDSEVWEVGP